eukprot:TRINITY_DN34045_c0_g1_i1.p1 TRINITY_DN34045_c0_g1~~TRINITY_DN34045_c0_g1_i1.p1  ORF type:complete len:559 (+),score=122.71 TRINITY_DN34045_c0_g1_i1:120-1796(+)
MAGRQVHILHFNDVYHAESYGGRSDRALRMWLAMQPVLEEYKPVVTFSGDAFAPSLMSSVTRGMHMMEALELLGVDIATLGNHDFDFGVNRAHQLLHEECLFEKEGALQKARSRWIMSNIEDGNGKPIAGTERYLVRTIGDVRVGFMAVSMDWLQLAGLSSSTDNPDKKAVYSDEVESARKWARHLRNEEKCELVLCLCHDNVPETELLAKEVLEVDAFLGGHEHVYQQASDGRYIIAGFDFQDFCLVSFDLPPAEQMGSVGDRRFSPKLQRFEVPGEGPLPTPVADLTGNGARIKKLVEQYERELLELQQTPLSPEVRFAAPLDTRKFKQRTQESVAGNLFADAIQAALQDKGAECCLIIGGIIGVGPALTEADTPLTLGHILNWFPWEGSTCLLEVPGQAILEALEHGCKDLPRREGLFPQVSGIQFNILMDTEAPAGQPGSPHHRVSEVLVAGAPLEPTRLYRLATTDWVGEGGDGYTMLGSQKQLIPPEGGPMIHSVVKNYLTSKAPLLEAPGPVGRIRHLKAFRMHVEPEEIGATMQDPKDESELLVPTWPPA